jgi:hypothetical protein
MWIRGSKKKRGLDARKKSHASHYRHLRVLYGMVGDGHIGMGQRQFFPQEVVDPPKYYRYGTYSIVLHTHTHIKK